MLIIILANAKTFDWNNLIILLLAIVSAWTAYRMEQRVKQAKIEEEKRETDRKQLQELSRTVDKVSEQTDGINKQLVAAEKIISKDEGKKEERAEVAERGVVADAAAAAAAVPAEPTLVKVLSSPEEPVITKPAPKTP